MQALTFISCVAGVLYYFYLLSRILDIKVEKRKLISKNKRR